MLTKKDWRVRWSRGGEEEKKEREERGRESGRRGEEEEGRRGEREGRRGERGRGKRERGERGKGEEGREKRGRGQGGRGKKVRGRKKELGMSYFTFSLSQNTSRESTDLQNMPGLLPVKGVHILVTLRGPQNLHCYIYSLWR